MLVIGDFKQLEWNACAMLSKDPVAIQELNDNVDQHALNQEAFNLPERRVAKYFMFRLIYGGTAAAYAADPDFTHVSTKPKFWQERIDAFYDKYTGVAEWHKQLMQRAMETGCIILPTGRIFEYRPVSKNGDWVWPRTTILNYPVQGLGADLMILARILLQRLLVKNNMESRMVGTIHDSIITDGPDSELEKVKRAFYSAWEKLPGFFEHSFGVKYPVICRVDLKYGHRWDHTMNKEKD